jgi:hypothetical protein
MLSPDFRLAVWRGTTNTDGNEIGISFDLADGAVIRLRLAAPSARNAAESILGYLAAGAGRMSSQSESSSGSPSLAVSPQDAENV